MKRRPDPQDVLLRLLAGDLSPDDPEARELLEESREAREELEALREIEAEVATASAQQREILGEAEGRSVDADPAEDAVLEGFRQTAATHSPVHAEASGARWIAAAAAILLALLWLGSRGFGPAEDDGSGAPYLGPPGEAGDTVTVPTYTVFQWSEARDLNAVYHLRIYDGRPGQEGRVLIEEDELEATLWTYDRARHPELPDRIRVQVQARAVSGFETEEVFDAVYQRSSD